MKLKFRILAVVILLLAVVGGAFAGYMFIGFYPENTLVLDYVPDKPIADDLDMITNLKVPTSETEKIKLAYDLYKLANENDQKADGRMFYSFCPTNNVAMQMPQKIDLYIFNIKDGDEFFKIDYRVKNSVPLLDVMPGFNEGLELVTTERQYYNPKLGKVFYEKVKNASLDKVPTAQWDGKIDDKSVKITAEHRDAPFYNKSQELKYEKFDHTVAIDTIKSANIEITPDGVKVVAELDVANVKTTERTIELIRKGARDPNAKYTKIVVGFELWKSGYYKTTSQTEQWTGTAMGITQVVSDFDYKDVYVYDKLIYGLDKWYDAQEIKEKCAKGLPPVSGKK